MNPNEYAALARETAVFPPTHAQEYLALGLVNELCEFYPKYMDWVEYAFEVNYNVNYDPSREKELRAAAIDELGDCMWYFVMYCDVIEQLPGTFFDGSVLPVSEKYLFLRIGEFTGAVKKLLRGDTHTLKLYGTIHAMLHYFAAHMNQWAQELETTLEDVMVANIEKLKARKERNTLHGSGDNR